MTTPAQYIPPQFQNTIPISNGSSTNWGAKLQGEQRDAYSALTALFNSYGLGSLAGKIYDYLKEGYGADTIALLLQDTPEYKQRFAANEARRKAGLPVLSPAEYLAAESSYRQILQDAGLPKGFYDNPADFQGWIAGDVSPTEVKTRVDLEVQAVSQANPEFKRALRQLYGVDEAGIVAYFLDQSRAVPILQKQAAAAQIASAALRLGISQVGRTDAEYLATMGVTGDQAIEGFGKISESFNPLRAIAERFGTSWDLEDAEEEVFVPGAPGARRGRMLRSQERALFAGSSGSAARGGLAASARQT
ncbi:hypothetical protein [Streptomyces hoynatensis]|uniref:Uncharacterized protein n=1 Tax=Streptomyces hoynatensis TaxID=1141874 RepID=A0A3A9YGI1_9ACTN|nr:hypothetical protein [Streptomyces hoynatensis]RKN35943.1 hypothetical protein D7294_30400 [Streptomyces hoynatensis]